MMAEDEDLKEKKLRGSGGFIIARVFESEQKKGNLGGPELFIAGIGRLDKDRILKYYCNKCEKDYPKSPDIIYENPNEEVGEGVILVEKGEYKCASCKSTISQYRKFNKDEELIKKSPSSNEISKNKLKQENISSSSPGQENKKITSSKSSIEQKDLEIVQKAVKEEIKSSDVRILSDKYFPIESIIGMPIYDNEAMLVGNVKEIGLRKSSNGVIQITIKVNNSKVISEDQTSNKNEEITWSNISKIGDIVLISHHQNNKLEVNNANNQTKPKICSSCMNQNESDAIYCEDCGKKLS